jgi:predicted DNA-binding mobile mystery protein A
MRDEPGNLQLRQLDRTLESFRAVQALPRPHKGWIRAMREARGVSAGEVGRILGTSRQLPLQFEKAEAEDTITLKSLRSVAHALDCELVYALVPRAGSKQKQVEARTRTATRKTVPGAKRTAALKGKAVKRIDAAVEAKAPAASAEADESTDSYFCD